MNTEDIRFCPRCGAPVELRERFGKLRPVCTACGHTVFIDPKVAVAALVTRQTSTGEEILLIKRANEPGRGKWSVPAGFVEPEEDPRAAVERETFEETGIAVTVDRLITLLHRPDPDGLADIVLIYAAHPVDSSSVLRAEDDAEAVGWFSRDALPEIALASTHYLIERWLAGNL